jgi:hypothetical protein
MGMNADLKQTLQLLNAHRADALASQRMDDEKYTQLCDLLSEMSGDQFIGLVELASDKAGVAMRAGAKADHLVYELAAVGWAKVLESLKERVELEQEAA